MDVKEGYKMTDVGVIPLDWEVISFNKAFLFLSTASYSRSQLESGGNILYIHYGDIHTKWNHFINFDKNILPSIPDDLLNNYSLIQEGDLIMADASEDYNGIGKSVEVTNLKSRKVIAGLHTFLLRDRGFFAHLFKGYLHINPLIKFQLDKLATGLKVYGISKKNLKLVEIPLPPLKEQKAIATALSDIDHLLQSLDQLIAKKRAIKQGAMQQLLTPPAEGGKRLEGFSGAWEKTRLGDLCQIFGRIGYRGYTVKDIVSESDGAITLSPSNIKMGTIDFSNLTYISWLKYEESPEIKIFNGDILLVKTGSTFGKTAIVKKLNKKATINPQLVVLKKIRVDNYFLSYLMGYRIIQTQIASSVVGGAIPTLSQEIISNFAFFIPQTLQEQKAIAQILTDMDTEIETLKQQRAKYQSIKQGMMQELLTGKTRLV